MTKIQHSRHLAVQVIRDLVSHISSSCEKIEIAGSIRRMKPTVGDIELLVIPHYQEVEVRKDLFTWAIEQECLLTMQLMDLMFAGVLRTRLKSNGSPIAGLSPQARFVALEYITPTITMPVDIFIIRPDRLDWWGWHLLLRTGPGDANQYLVTPRHKWGAKPSNILIEDGMVIADGRRHPLPTEESVFALWGMEYIAPPNRSVESYKAAIPPLFTGEVAAGRRGSPLSNSPRLRGDVAPATEGWMGLGEGSDDE